MKIHMKERNLIVAKLKTIEYTGSEHNMDCYCATLTNGQTRAVWLPSYALDSVELEEKTIEYLKKEGVTID